jgi:hypothetical protein
MAIQLPPGGQGCPRSVPALRSCMRTEILMSSRGIRHYGSPETSKGHAGEGERVGTVEDPLRAPGQRTEQKCAGVRCWRSSTLPRALVPGERQLDRAIPLTLQLTGGRAGSAAP